MTTMKWKVELVVTQRWRVEVEADDLVEAEREAKLAYDREPNPWEALELEPVGDEKVDCVKADYF